MSSIVVDDLSAPWVADASGLWTVAVGAGLGRTGAGHQGMSISARGGAANGSVPFAQLTLQAPLDLRAMDELRFWLRASRGADGSAARPFYLAVEIAGGGQPLNPPFVRLLPIGRGQSWELQQIWLGDLPLAARQAVGAISLRALDPTLAFEAAISDVVAAHPEPIQDLDRALVDRIDRRYRVTGANNQPIDVPAILDVPESPGERALPYVLVTPWSVRPGAERAGAGDVIDNFTALGAYTRPARRALQLEYRVDVYAESRAQKALLLEGLLADFALRHWLAVAGDYLQLVPFFPSPEEVADLVGPGRTPLFYRVLTQVELGARQLMPLAQPKLVVGQPLENQPPEAVTVP